MLSRELLHRVAEINQMNSDFFNSWISGRTVRLRPFLEFQEYVGQFSIAEAKYLKWLVFEEE